MSEVAIAEARKLLEAAFHSTDESRSGQLISWVREILQPLVQSQNAEAMWILCCIPVVPHGSQNEFDALYHAQVRSAAEAGSLEAKFRLACELDETETQSESATLFKEVAESGHPYAMWCHGLNLLSGKVLKKDVACGLEYIRRAAELNFEGAIRFISAAYASGTYGFRKDESEAAQWWKRLSRKNVVRY